MFGYSFQFPIGYIGPGAGLGFLMALAGLLIAVGAALFSVLAWPIRNLLKRRRASQQNSGNGPA